MKVLVVDNNVTMLNFLCDLLNKEGFEVITAESGKVALTQYQQNQPDFICLDVMMPDMSGYDVCKEIRKTDDTTPIIFISSKDQIIDKVAGLEIGGDDYIIKPFDTHEVIARIRAIARRSIKSIPESQPNKNDNEFVMLDIKIITNKLCAMRGESIIDLSLRDLKILKLLYDNKGMVVHRDTLIDYCWGAHIMPESRTVDWHMSQLRKKIEVDSKSPIIIKTVHGVGYRYEES